MITAHIKTKDGKSFTHTFNTKNVKTVHSACQKILGEPLRNSIAEDGVQWNFVNGSAKISGYCWFGNRQDSVKIRKALKEAAKEKA